MQDSDKEAGCIHDLGWVHKALLQIGTVHALSLSDCSVLMLETQHTKARQPNHVMGAWRRHMVPLCSATKEERRVYSLNRSALSDANLARLLQLS